jgi:hypothetical protein
MRRSCTKPTLGTLQFDRSVEQPPQPADSAALERLLRLNLLQTAWQDSLTLHEALATPICNALQDRGALAASEEIVVAACSRPPPDLLRLALRLVALKHLVNAAAPANDERAARLMTLLACHLRLAGELSAADIYRTQALALWRNTSDLHPGAGLFAGTELAQFMRDLGDLDGAQALVLDLRGLAEQSATVSNPHLIRALRGLAVLVDAQGDSATSLRLLRQAEAAA